MAGPANKPSQNGEVAGKKDCQQAITERGAFAQRPFDEKAAEADLSAIIKRLDSGDWEERDAA
ncbi:MAG: hypothetical protein QXH27_02690, partial [Candidatus Micrarchaeia archaeon]